jgi:putative component of toxin-antitoxin plasmid stabilization module
MSFSSVCRCLHPRKLIAIILRLRHLSLAKPGDTAILTFGVSSLRDSTGITISVQRITVTFKKVAGIEVVLAAVLLF